MPITLLLSYRKIDISNLLLLNSDSKFNFLMINLLSGKNVLTPKV